MEACIFMNEYTNSFLNDIKIMIDDAIKISDTQPQGCKNYLVSVVTELSSFIGLTGEKLSEIQKQQADVVMQNELNEKKKVEEKLLAELNNASDGLNALYSGKPPIVQGGLY